MLVFIYTNRTQFVPEQKSWQNMRNTYKVWPVGCSIYCHSIHSPSNTFPNIWLGKDHTYQIDAKHGMACDEYTIEGSALQAIKPERIEHEKEWVN